MELDDVTRDRIRDMAATCGLDDRQLRTYLAIEAHVLGPGSEAAVASAAGVDVGVVLDGLLTAPPLGPMRRAGARG